MPRALDGTPHHSNTRARMHDQNVTTKAAPAAAAKTMDAGMNHPAATPTPIEEHVSQHGPATKMSYEHDKAANIHHVTSHHGEGEGNPHHSQHKTSKAAHEHMGKSLGVKEGQSEQDNETPDTEDETDNEMAASGGGIPGMS